MKRLSPSTGVAVGVGAVMVLALLFSGPLFEGLRWLFLDWAVLVSGVAVFAAFLYFLQSQWKLILERRSGWPYRAIMVVAAVTAFAFTLLRPRSPWLLEYVLIPGGAAFLALLAIVVTYRGLWMAFRRERAWAWVFAGVVTLLLILDIIRGSIGPVFLAEAVWYWAEHVVTRAGVRGLLLAMALGLMATGLRVLGGVDRPYEE